jgi:hypothetical protein
MSGDDRSDIICEAEDRLNRVNADAAAAFAARTLEIRCPHIYPPTPRHAPYRR